MSDGIAYADILILALIAGFILLRLRSVLGQKGGPEHHQFSVRSKPKPEQNKEKIIQLQDKAIKIIPKKEEDEYLDKLDKKHVADALKKIKEKDAAFNASQFLKGARAAFEMVHDAFTKSDEHTLKMLLSESIFEEFKEELKKRGESENKTETTLVAVLSSNIEEATLFGKLARISVKFVSEQVTVVRNSKGEIVDGDASQTEHVENEWVFERDINSKNPNWKIIET